MIDLERRLPEGWAWQPLKHVTTRLSRGTAPDYVDDGPVHAVSQAVNQEYGLDWSRGKFHGYWGDPKNLKGYLEHRDILINSTGTGTLGRIGFFEGAPDDRPCVADGHVTIARTRNDMLDPRFTYYWLGSPSFYGLIYSALTVGSTNQIELSRERLAAAPVPVPSLEEQRRIADFLDSETCLIEHAIRSRRRQVGMLAEREANSLLEIFGATRGMVRTKIKFLLAKRPRYGVLVPRFVDEGVPFIRVNDLLELDKRAKDLVHIAQDVSNQYPSTVVEVNDILVSVVGTLGRVSIAGDSVRGANVNRPIAVLRPKPHVDRHLLAAWISGKEFERKALMATGGDSAQPTLGMEDMANFDLRWPEDQTEQHRLSSKVQEMQSDARDLDRALQRQCRVLMERRQALITAAVTGQIDVTTARGADVA